MILIVVRELHHGDSGGQEDESTSSEEDDDGVELTPTVDVQIMKLIAAIRHKDQRIYDPNSRFFTGMMTWICITHGLIYCLETDEAAVPKDLLPKGSASERAYRLKDYHRETLLRGEIPGDIQEEGHEKLLSHADEQEALKKELKVRF